MTTNASETTPALDFQTAAYEALCGCVAAMIPAGMNHLWKGDQPNHAATEYLIRNAVGNRVSLSDCPKCGGTGIAPSLVENGPRPLCGHRLFPGFPLCTLPADHAEPWHRHHKDTVPNNRICN